MSKIKCLVLGFCAVMCAGGSFADELFTVVKSSIKNISGDSDVSTRGTRLVGMTANKNDYTVNGQKFCAGYSWNGAWDPYYWFSGTAYRTCGGYGDTTILPSHSGLSSNYENALNGLKKSGNYTSVSYKQTNCGLRGFKVGKYYELQIWVSDAAATIDNTVTITIGGQDFTLHPNVATNGVNEANEPVQLASGLGQFLTVEMVAHVESSDHFFFYGDGSTFPGEYNMLQMRELESGPDATATYTWAPNADEENPLWMQSGTNWNDSTGVVVSDETVLWDDAAGVLNKAQFPADSTIPVGMNLYVNEISTSGNTTISNNFTVNVARFTTTGSLTMDGYGYTYFGDLLNFNGNLTMNDGALFVNGNLTGASAISLKENVQPINIERSSRFEAGSVTVSETLPIAVASSGSGCLTTAGAIEMTSSGDMDFTGILKSSSLVKKGAGTVKFIGYGTNQTAVTVKEGTLKIVSPADLSGVAYDFDASDADSVTVTDGVLSWKDRARARTFKYQDQSGNNSDTLTSTPATYDTETYFGGRGAVTFADKNDATSHTQLRLDKAQSLGSVFIVYWEDVIRQYAQIMGETANKNMGIGRRNATKASDGNNKWVRRANSSGSGGTTLLNTDENVWAKIGQGKAEEVYVPVVGPCMRTDSKIVHMLGSCATASSAGISYTFCGAIGEVLAFNRDITHPERRVVSKYLAAKWGIGSNSYVPINPSAKVTVAAGAKLDLGVFAGATVVDVELADGAVLAVDSLPADGAIFKLTAGTAKRYSAVKFYVGGVDCTSKYRIDATATALTATKISGMKVMIR